MSRYSTEADRLRVILETLSYAHPDMPLHEAVPMVYEIEKRTAKLERVPMLHGVDGDNLLPNCNPDTIANWIDTQPDIIELVDTAKKINAIKEVRGRVLFNSNTAGLPVSYTHPGLKEAKGGVEYWDRTRRGK